MMLGVPGLASSNLIDLRQYFPMANLGVLEGVQPLSGRTSLFPLVHLAVSSTAIFDSEKLPLPQWRKWMAERTLEPMGEGHAYAFVRGLLDLNDLSPDLARYPLVRVDLVTNMERQAYQRVNQSLIAHGFGKYVQNLSFRTVSRVNLGDDIAPNIPGIVRAVRATGALFYLCSKLEFAEAVVKAGIGAAAFQSHGQIRPYNPLEKRIYITDGDGTLWHDRADQVYERALAETGDYMKAVETFNAYVFANQKTPEAIGPAYALVRGLILLSRLFETPENRGQSPIYNMLSTARGLFGQAQVDAFNDSHDLSFHEECLRAGLSKNPNLAGAQILLENSLRVLQQASGMPPEEIPAVMAMIPPGFLLAA